MDAGAFLQWAGSNVGAGELRRDPAGGEMEWRGECQGLPTRIAVTSGGSCEVMLKVAHVPSSFTLQYDPDKLPRPGIDDDPFSDGDTVRVFVGKHVFIETFAIAIANSLEEFRAMPAELMDHVIAAMSRDRVMYFRARNDRFEVDFKDPLDRMSDRGAGVVRFIQLAAWVAGHVQRSTPEQLAALRRTIEAALPHDLVARSGAQAATPIQLKCPYCATRFLLDPAARCPNCGAPAQ